MKIGFNSSKIVEVNGFSGGLWTMWNNGKTQIYVYDSSSQSICLIISSGNGVWIPTCLYVSTYKFLRQELWNYLTAIHSSH